MNTPAQRYLQEFNARHHGREEDLDGVTVARDYGDSAAETVALLEGVGVVARENCGVILLRGDDAASFLNGLTTNDVEKLQTGQAQPNLLCANKGKILYPVEVVRTGPDQLLVVCQPGAQEAVAGHLDAYLIREAVEMGRVGLMRLDLIGPKAAEAVAALGHSLQEGIGAFHDAPVLTLDFPLGSLPRVMVLLPAPVASAWLEALLEAAPEVRPAGMTALEEARIWAGAPRFGVDYQTDHLPAEAGLYERMSFNKGCYVGQEIHARLHYRGHVNRKLVGLEMPAGVGAAQAPANALYQGDQEVGALTSIGHSPINGRLRGIGMVRYETIQRALQGADEKTAEETGLSVTLGGAPEIAMRPLATDLGGGRQ